MTTTVEFHGVKDAKMERKSSNGTHWIVLTATNSKDEMCEVTLFHDGTLRVDADANCLPRPDVVPQGYSGSALPRPGAEVSP